MSLSYKWAGIDYSMSCPALHISNDPNDFNSGLSFFIISVEQKSTAKFAKDFGNVIGIPMCEFSSNEERFDFISETFLNILKQ